jgi:hypothetical protein
LTLDNDAIARFLEGYEQDARAIKEEALRFCWWMRGGITYEDAMLLSKDEREIISKIIKENLENTKKSGMPFF